MKDSTCKDEGLWKQQLPLNRIKKKDFPITKGFRMSLRTYVGEPVLTQKFWNITLGALQTSKTHTSSQARNGCADKHSQKQRPL
jgi:hypothetical protein